MGSWVRAPGDSRKEIDFNGLSPLLFIFLFRKEYQILFNSSKNKATKPLKSLFIGIVKLLLCI